MLPSRAFGNTGFLGKKIAHERSQISNLECSEHKYGYGGPYRPRTAYLRCLPQLRHISGLATSTVPPVC